MSTADKLQQLRLERQKSDLSYKLQALQVQLERAESEKHALAEESGNKIKQALNLLDTARREIDKLKREKESLAAEVTDLKRQNTDLRTSTAASLSTGKTSTEQARAADAAHATFDDVGLSALRGGKSNGARFPVTASSNECESNDDWGVVVRRTPKEDASERPMSMAERMSMFESKKSSGRSFGNGPATNGVATSTNNWRNTTRPPPVKLVAEEATPAGNQSADSSPVTMRSVKVSQHAKDNRHTMPANAYTPKQVIAAAPAPAPTPKNTEAGHALAASGRTKLKTALGGMMAAIETEKQHKGIDDPDFSGPKPTPGFIGLVNTVAPKNPVKRAQSVAAPGSAASKKAALLHWCKRMTDGKENVEIKNFSSSWNNGMAFCALFHHFIPDQIPYDTLDPRNREHNFRLAFEEGEKAGVTALLDVEDCVDMKNPDWMSVMTYISLIYNHFNGIRVGGPRLPPMPGQEE